MTSDKAQDTSIYDFSYVFDVYIDGVYVNRFIQRPNPAGAGMIDVSSMIDPYLEIGNFANEVGVPSSQPWKMGSNAICNVKIYAGEQYRLDPKQTYPDTYEGISDAQGNPAYPLGAQSFYDDLDPTDDDDILPVFCLPASLDWAKQQQHLGVQATGPTDYYGTFGYMAPYVLKNDSIYPSTSCAGPGLFLSQAPRIVDGGAWQITNVSPSYNINTDALEYDRYTVTFLNRNPVYEYFQGSPSLLQETSPKVAWFNFYSATGNIGDIVVGNYQVDDNDDILGGGPRYSCGDSITTSGTGSYSVLNNKEFLSLRVGPKDLEDQNVFTNLGQVPEYYTVQLYNSLNITGSCGYTGSPTVPVSELLTINIVEDCYSYLYPRARVVWLNSLGGRDYWNFTMKAEETVDASQQTFYQTEIDWSSTTPVVLSGDTTQNWLRGGVHQYNKAVKRKWTITSDFLTQEQVEFLKGIVMSPQTWVYIGQEDFPYTCTVTEQSYTVKTIKQVKLFTANFNLEFSTEQSMQNI
ncbi:MAG: hypothetical protein ACO3EY_03605 [Candidatus Nanopelagicales bacterium]